MALVGTQAPLITAPAVINGTDIIENFSLKQFLGKQEVVLFFYPKDFTYVCPTELFAFQQKLKAFKDRGVALVGCSTDTAETHRAWLSTAPNNGGIAGVTYPLIADESKTIAANFGVLRGLWEANENDQLFFKGEPVASRATFFIDKQGIVRHESINDLPLGRNIHETLRIIDMWHHTSKHGQVCPANWQEGEQAIMPTTTEVAKYLSTHMVAKTEKQPEGCSGNCRCHKGL